MAQIDYHRYESYDLTTKYGWMQTGDGPAAAQDAARFLGNAANAYADSDAILRTAMKGALDWQGGAATAAAGSLNRAASWVTGAGTAGRTGSTSVDRFGGSFAELKPKIAAPTDLPGWASFAMDATAPASVFGVQTDAAHVTAQTNKALDDEANRALYAHEAASRDALGGFPTLSASPATTSPAAAGGAGGGGGPGGTGLGAAGVVTGPAGSGAVAGGGGPGVGPGGAGVPSGPATGPGLAPFVPGAPGGGGRAAGSALPRSPGGGTAASRSGSGVSPPLGRGGPLGGGAPRTPGVPGRGPGSAGLPAGELGATAGAASAGRAAGAGSGGFMGPPWAGGGARQQGGSEHRNRYAMPSDEAFHPELPPHAPAVLGGS